MSKHAVFWILLLGVTFVITSTQFPEEEVGLVKYIIQGLGIAMICSVVAEFYDAINKRGR